MAQGVKPRSGWGLTPVLLVQQQAPANSLSDLWEKAKWTLFS